MKERVISLGILVFALVYLAGSIALKVGNLAEPGPGFVPAGIAFALLLAAAYNAYKSFKETAKEEGETWLKMAPIGIALSIVIYPIILRPLSYLIATFLVLFSLLWIMNFKSRLVQFTTALFTTVLSFVIFSKILGVVLPSGFLEELILRL